MSALFRAALRFKEIQPWEWMFDSDLFAVRDPETGEIGYCCVMGNLGEHYALAVYRGSEGLDGYLRMQEGEIPEDPLDALALQFTLMASFEDREMLSKDDRQIIKELGLKFRGRNAWPQFRSYRPGYVPWYLSGGEARFLTVALEQAADVAHRCREDPDLFDRLPEGHVLLRELEPGGEWRDVVHRPPAYVPPEPEVPPVDEGRLRALAELSHTDGVLEMGYFLLPDAVKEPQDERPWYPHLILAMDHRSGFIFGQEMARPNEVHAVLLELLLHTLETLKMLPAEILVDAEEACMVLQPTAHRLKVKVREVDYLDAVEDARESLSGFLGGMGMLENM
jgi:hypothetical protein